MRVPHTVETLYEKLVFPAINSLRVYPLIVTDSVFGGTFPVSIISSGVLFTNRVVTLALLFQYFAGANTSSPLTVVLDFSILDMISVFFVYPSSDNISENPFRLPVGSMAHPERKMLLVLRWSSMIFPERDVPICQ